MCFIFNIHRVVFVLISELFAEFLGQPEASLKSFHVLVFCVFYNVSLHFTFFLYLESWIKNLKFRVSYSVFCGLTTVQYLSPEASSEARFFSSSDISLKPLNNLQISSKVFSTLLLGKTRKTN